ncbi:hypothetical protein BE15_29690 [Sorangium cellulosum]|uniref:Uncharacterized protein n=1 Tax=Sorangium cellulosum TaxID=56 RepID=A0A150QI64_SORCE|nr:hypothetical protein BE15_29690 [Sorangium cellulosum]
MPVTRASPLESTINVLRASSTCEAGTGNESLLDEMSPLRSKYPTPVSYSRSFFKGSADATAGEAAGGT